MTDSYLDEERRAAGGAPMIPQLWSMVRESVIDRDPEAYMAKLNAWRMKKLVNQISYCFMNDFYRDSLRAAGVSDPRDITTIEEFRSLPAFMTKELHRESQRESLERYGHPFGMHLCARPETVVHVAGTSGTTGLPTFYLFTRRDLENTCTILGRTFAMSGIHPGDSVLQLYGLSIWVAGVTSILALESYGARPIPLGAEAGITKALQYIEMCRPKVVFGTPSMITRLIDRAPEQLGRDLNTMGIEIINSGGEPGLAISASRRRLMQGTGAKIYDVTAGAWLNAAMDCGGPEHNGLHYLAEDYSFRYDLVDPVTRKPIPLVDGAEGEAIHTGLDYDAAPALRYATGDIVRIRIGECPNCGQFGTRFVFVGRADDLMNVGGVKVYPAAVKEVVESLAPRTSGRMQIVLEEDPPHVIPPVRIEVEAGDSGIGEEGDDSLRCLVEREVHRVLKIRTAVEVVPRGSIPVSSLKSKLYRVEK